MKWTDPDRIDLDLSVQQFNGSSQLRQRNHQILKHNLDAKDRSVLRSKSSNGSNSELFERKYFHLNQMMILVNAFHCSGVLHHVQDSWVRWEAPANTVSQDWRVSSWNQSLQLPEHGSRVTMIVVHQRNVFSSCSTLNECLNMFVEPRFVPLKTFIDEFYFPLTNY